MISRAIEQVHAAGGVCTLINVQFAHSVIRRIVGSLSGTTEGLVWVGTCVEELSLHREVARKAKGG